MKLRLAVSAFVAYMLTSAPVWADLMPGSLALRWDGGAQTCTPASASTPIQVHRYNAQTFVLRETLCATWEAPFLYLLVGSKQALLIDTGDIADPKLMPVEAAVMNLLPGDAALKLPLIVVHSHGHLDHRAGDPQFEHVPGIELVPSDLAHVRKYFSFSDWPNGRAQIDLGDRIIDVLPAPGHHPAQLVYFDRNTGLVFSGDFLLPGRLLVDNFDDYEASARRVADFLKDRPVSYVLGGHIEKSSAGELFPWQSTHHPDERVLQLTKEDALALPTALRSFNGFYTKTGDFVIENPIRNLIAVAIGTLVILVALGILLFRVIRRRRRARAPTRAPRPPAP
jgi:hydroxyacylglutathione hydrolase